MKVLKLAVGEEVEADGLVAIEGEEAGGVDLVPHFKHAYVAEAELTLAKMLCLELVQTAACWKSNPCICFQARERQIEVYCQ